MHLLNNSDIDKLDNLSLKARYIVEGFILGLHKSPYHGFSVEFSENRKYEPGDEMKFIDWKVWAKTDRYYVKQFEEETNLLCYILIDQSNSMKYKSKQTSKLDYVKILASAFSYLILKQQVMLYLDHLILLGVWLLQYLEIKETNLNFKMHFGQTSTQV